jgi:hypothetical protein
MTAIYMIMLILACLISVEGVALWKLRKCLKSIDGVEDVYIEEHQEETQYDDAYVVADFGD